MRRYGYNPSASSGPLIVGDRVTIYALTIHIAGAITRKVLWPKGSITKINLEEGVANVQWDMGGGSQHPLDKLKKL